MPDAASPTCLLDVTRLLSRAGRGPLTGIDRVELAWLEVLLARGGPLFGLAQDAGAQVLLDAAGLSALRDRLTGRAEWGPPDLRARLRLRQPAARRRALSDLRRLGLAHGSLARMPGIVARHVPAPFVYLNAGHSNLQPRLLSGLQRRAGARVTVLIHDTIPLDHPDLTREGI